MIRYINKTFHTRKVEKLSTRWGFIPTFRGQGGRTREAASGSRGRRPAFSPQSAPTAPRNRRTRGYEDLATNCWRRATRCDVKQAVSPEQGKIGTSRRHRKAQRTRAREREGVREREGGREGGSEGGREGLRRERERDSERVRGRERE